MPQEDKNSHPSKAVKQSTVTEESDMNDNNRFYTEENPGNEIATNDGAIIETLDTTLHGKPGWVEGENISGSNRADYYESRSNGQSDSEEELNAIKKDRQEE
jgi:hypothetical protein